MKEIYDEIKTKYGKIVDENVCFDFHVFESVERFPR